MLAAWPQRTKHSPPWSRYRVLCMHVWFQTSLHVQILHVMEQHTVKDALLDWLQSRPSARLLPLLFLQEGNLRLAARPASLSRLPVNPPPPPTPPQPPAMHQRVQRIVHDELTLLRHLWQWPRPGGGVGPIAQRLWEAALAACDATEASATGSAADSAGPSAGSAGIRTSSTAPLVKSEYANLLLDTGDAESLLALLQPRADEEVSLLLHAIGRRHPPTQAVLTPALFGALHRPPTWNEVGVLLHGNNRRRAADAIALSSSHTACKIAVKAVQGQRYKRVRHPPNHAPKEKKKGPSLPHTHPKLLCPHLLCAMPGDDVSQQQRRGLDAHVPSDVDIAKLTRMCSATKPALAPLKMQCQLALQTKTIDPSLVAMTTALIGAHATGLEGYQACRLLLLLDSTGVEVPGVAVSWALLGAVNSKSVRVDLCMHGCVWVVCMAHAV